MSLTSCLNKQSRCNIGHHLFITCINGIGEMYINIYSCRFQNIIITLYLKYHLHFYFWTVPPIMKVLNFHDISFHHSFQGYFFNFIQHASFHKWLHQNDLIRIINLVYESKLNFTLLHHYNTFIKFYVFSFGCKRLLTWQVGSFRDVWNCNTIAVGQ